LQGGGISTRHMPIAAAYRVRDDDGECGGWRLFALTILRSGRAMISMEYPAGAAEFPTSVAAD
jgi:hypothetical protein